ncbi:MAG: 3D domain-containing protein [Lachnospirales bacterium]
MAERFKVVIAICFLVIASVITATANDELQEKTIYVLENGENNIYTTTANTYLDFFREEGYAINTIETETDLNETLEERNEIELTAKVPVEIVVDSGESFIRYYDHGTTIGDVLEDIQDDEHAYVAELVEEETVVTNNYILNVKSLDKEILEEVVAVPFETEYVEDPTIKEGVEEVAQEGVDGEGVRNIEVIYYAGEEIERNDLDVEVLVEPVNKVVKIGTLKANQIENNGITIPPALSGYNIDVNNLTYNNVITMNATAYTAGPESTGKSPGHPSYGITASGAVAQDGTVAVDPNVIPLGTKLYVEGYGLAIAQDTGGAIKGNKIDLFYHSLSEALQFGRRSVKVYVLN